MAETILMSKGVACSVDEVKDSFERWIEFALHIYLVCDQNLNFVVILPVGMFAGY